MIKRRIFAFVLCLLTLAGCSGDSTAVPQTAEEVDSLADVLSFISGRKDVDVTDVQVQAESVIDLTEPVLLSEEDAGALLSLMETPAITAEQYEPLPVYGGHWYSVICTLENGETVTLHPKKDALTFTRAELNEEGKWHYPTYRILFEESDVPEAIYTAVRQFWSDAYSIPAGETRTMAQMLGEEILGARQVILRASYEGDSDTEIRLYVDTAKHPDLLDALTGLTIEQTEIERDRNSYVSVAFHMGEEDYQFGKHLLENEFTMRGERIEISVGTGFAYCPTEPFAGWLKDWIYSHKDDDGVKIVRWDVE